MISLILFSMHLQAALSTSSTLEFLSMPEEKRFAQASLQKAELYPSLINVAFAEEHSIPMRWKALTLAAQINPGGSKADLERALRGKEWFMKNAALTAIQGTRPELLQEVALRLIKDKALVVRSAAVSAIAVKPSQKIRDLLWNELNADYNFRKGQSLWVRGQIVEKLAHHPQKHEYQAFGIALRSNDETLHVPAMIALEKISKTHFGSAKSTIKEKRKLWLQHIRQYPYL
jgi:hypothetical protein